MAIWASGKLAGPMYVVIFIYATVICLRTLRALLHTFDISCKIERFKCGKNPSDCSSRNFERSTQILQIQVATLKAIGRNDQPEERAHF
jgi:hypothetical protein